MFIKHPIVKMILNLVVACFLLGFKDVCNSYFNIVMVRSSVAATLKN